MINEQELKQHAERHKVIKRAAESIKKKQAEKFTQRRREAEFKRDLKNAGVE